MYGSQTLYKSDDGGEVPSVGERWESLQGSHLLQSVMLPVMELIIRGRASKI